MSSHWPHSATFSVRSAVRLPAHYPRRPDRRRSSSGWRRSRPWRLRVGVFEPVLELLSHLAGDGAVVCGFEDLHWADPLTWDLFDFLARNLVDEHVVLVGTYRANESRRQSRNNVAVSASSPACRLRTACSSGDSAAMSSPRRSRPLTLIGAPRARARRRDPRSRSGQPVLHRRARRRPPQRAGDPGRPVRSHRRRSRRSRCRQPLGRRRHRRRRARHRPRTPDAGRRSGRRRARSRAVSAAIDAQLVVVDRDTDAYRFRHALIGEVVYDELLPPERKRLHRRVADALRRPDRRTCSPAPIAPANWPSPRQGRRSRRRRSCALLAAADAAETVAPAAALRHLERALELWDSAGEPSAPANRGDRLWQAAELASGAAGNQRAADLAREAFRYGAPPRGAAWGHERLGRYLWAAGHLEDSARRVRDGRRRPAARRRRTRGGAGLRRVGTSRAHARPLRRRRGASRSSVFDLLGRRRGRPAGVGDGAAGARHRRRPRGRPRPRRRALPRGGRRRAERPHETLAVLYLGVALLDAGRYQEAVNEMLDAAAEARLTGLDRSFGGYLDALAAGGAHPTRPVVRGRHDSRSHSEGTEAFPSGSSASRSPAPCSPPRRGDGDRAHALLAEAEARPVDPFHRWFLDRAAAEVASRTRRLGRAAAAADERALTRGATALWQARFVMFGIAAEVELALDARARREPFDPDATAARLRGRIDAARRRGRTGQGTESRHSTAPRTSPTPPPTLTRLADSDPEAWAEAARRWARPRRSVLAGDGSRPRGRSRGRAERPHEQPRRCERRTSSPPSSAPRPLLTDIEAVSRRTRLSVEAPVARDHGEDARSISSASPPREAEVLSLVAAGQTNRQIGEACSCPRRPRASTSRTSCASSGSAAESTPPPSRNASVSPDDCQHRGQRLARLRRADRPARHRQHPGAIGP